jgi:hypothetical protein
MSRCCDGGCSKVNYAAYVKKNMPHCIRIDSDIDSIYIYKTLFYSKRLHITLDGGKLCGIIILSIR